MPYPNLGLFHHKQQGAALIISLTFLLLLTVLGVAAMRSATLQERMAGNSRDAAVAMQSAEYGIQQAEAVLGAPAFLSTNYFGNDPAYVTQIPQSSTAAWWESDAHWIGAQSLGLTNSADALRANYMVERFPPEENALSKVMGSIGQGGKNRIPKNFVTSYRITTRASGQSGNTTVILQEVYRRGDDK